MAFASATEYSFQLDKNSLLVYKANVQIQQTQFEYLNFDAQVITFNSRGYPSPETLTIHRQNKSEPINLFKLVEGVDARIEDK